MRKKDKTKFPVARIKKIMQMDDEVGKMAQATPVLISKSLELFMESIIDDVCKQAHVCSARKVTPTHLKRCIESTECYDFLKDIVESVVDDGDGGGAQACVAKVVEMDASRDTAEGHVDANADVDALGGGGGGAPLSMILDAPPLTSTDHSADTDDNTDDSSYNPRPSSTRGRGKGRGRGRGRGRTAQRLADTADV
ncbi:histone-fold-containing protein [Coemansia reversa NRRL 1564]|uniref:Histone-fold-containing protein n=1 Tax=Coemansia reversa (strain ATCC 12441 / NRRL 1564) TaxID=763665 RepID=A0A2G5BC58_COERN|nr:histone-fold-containing protein [Coemansia reversa NRRL 1564]|eukprot:PIA16582.1 histone-fold-containing protein [Coemansia reversa NRRL 1564]